MAEARFHAERRDDDMASKDQELVVRALLEAFSVVDDHDPDRNPARCMRQLRRLLDNISLRAATRRLAVDLPPDPRDPT